MDRPVPVSPLIVETPEQQQLYEEGERNSMRRKEEGKLTLLKHTPNDEESDLIHALWQKQVQWHGMRAPILILNLWLLTYLFPSQIQTSPITNPQTYHGWTRHVCRPPQSCSRSLEIVRPILQILQVLVDNQKQDISS